VSGISRFAIFLTLAASSFAVATVATAASAPTSTGGIGVRLLANASNTSAGPLTPSYIVERLGPGSRVIRDVEISNTTHAFANIVIFPAAARFVENKFSFEPGRTEDSLSRWTKVAHRVLRLAPGAVAHDAVTINVPKRASFGERYAVIWAEVSAPSPTQGGVRLVNRVGIRMYISVGRGGLPAAEFTVGSLVAGRLANGDALIVAKVHNVGAAAIDIVGKLTLSQGPGDLSAGPFSVPLGTMLAPNHSVTERVALGDRIPRGPWRADLALSSDGTQRSSITMITFPALTLGTGTRSLGAPVMLAALIVLMLLLAAGGSVVFSRRRLRLE
jgi:hypothetical protein